jgi:plastocyanin
MRSYKVKFIKGVVLSLLCLLMLHGCSPGSEKEAEKPAAIEEKGPTMYSIEMIQMKFYPAELKVKKGDKIVFVNHDIVAHDVTEEAKKAWNSSPMSEGQTWILVATETVNYYCSIHPVMKGKIVVE